MTATGYTGGGGGGAVSSVFGRTGVVTAQNGDYTAAQVGADPTGTAAGLVSTEATTRGNADTALQTNISNEATTRSSADTTLTTNLATEVTNRTNGDAALIPKATVTTKGDIIVATAGSTVSRLGVDASVNALIIPDTAAAGGLAWEIRDRVPPEAAAFGLQMVTMSDAAVAATFPLNAGVAVFNLVRVPAPISITALGVWITTSGTGPGTGDNNLGIYTEAGVLLAKTSDMSAAYVASGWQEANLIGGALALPRGSYYLHALTHMSAPPNIATSVSTPTFDRVALNAHPVSIFVSGSASSPASVTPSGLTANTVKYFLGAK